MSLVEILTGFPFSILHRAATRLFLRKMDYLVAQSSREETLLRETFPRARIGFIRGPYFTYPSHLAERIPSATAKKKIGVNGNIILFFGFVRPYKGLDYLVDALPDILEKIPNTTLLIAGEFWAGRTELEKKIDELGIRTHVKIVDTFIPANDVALYFSAADVCVIPYIAISQSAIIPHALSYGVPVIATDVGGNRDWVKEGVNGYLIPPRDANTISNTVATFFREKKANVMRENISRELKTARWTGAQQKIILGDF